MSDTKTGQQHWECCTCCTFACFLPISVHQQDFHEGQRNLIMSSWPENKEFPNLSDYFGKTQASITIHSQICHSLGEPYVG